MKRREEPVSSPSEVPVELAEGPRVSRWAREVLLSDLAALKAGDPRRRGAVEQVQLDAWGRWRNAIDLWAEDAGLDRLEGRRRVGTRAPWFDDPGTPLPSRIGYAASPESIWSHRTDRLEPGPADQQRVVRRRRGRR